MSLDRPIQLPELAPPSAVVRQTLRKPRGTMACCNFADTSGHTAVSYCFRYMFSDAIGHAEERATITGIRQRIRWMRNTRRFIIEPSKHQRVPA